MTDLLQLCLRRGGDLVRVRASVRRAGALLGLSDQDQVRLATAAAEVARQSAADTDEVSLRLQVGPGPDGVDVLCAVFQLPKAGAVSRPDTVEVVGRLLDHYEHDDRRWVLCKRLPGPSAVSADALDAARRQLAVDVEVDPVEALSEQNGELASALAELRTRESELLRLNDELAETNRGVLALYSELEHSAERIRLAQREVFTELENALRPPPPPLPDIELAIRYVPAQTNSPTGGDLYDWLVLRDGRLHVTVVDVVGHGVESTRAALDVTHALRTLSREGHELAELIARADELLEGTGALATVLLARLTQDTGELELAGGGHPPALLIPADGDLEYIEAKGRPIGFPGAGSLGASSVRLGRGDTVVLYTDGVIETGSDIDEGLDLLRATAGQMRHAELDELLDGLLSSVRERAPLKDDALLLGLRRL